MKSLKGVWCRHIGIIALNSESELEIQCEDYRDLLHIMFDGQINWAYFVIWDEWEINFFDLWIWFNRIGTQSLNKD